MPSELPGDITALLGKWSGGDESAMAEVASLAYDHLRSIAHAFLFRERRGEAHTLQATALVNEFYVKLMRQRSPKFENRAHFYHVAAMMMRRILTDYGRRTATLKRGGDFRSIPLHDDIAWIDAASNDIVLLDAALEELEQLDARAAQSIELRFFLGASTEATAEILKVSPATVQRDVRFALAWLRDRVDAHGGSGDC